ncbi:MAG: DMT family transporter [Alicyclobacillus sp.]|nr:DMT family transporter [Alicyclobacillus sp.]
MSGEFAALLSAVCYALSYMFVRKAQTALKTDELDNGLFIVLFVSGTVLSASLIVKFLIRPFPLVSGEDWELSIGCCVLAGIIGTLLGRLALFAAIVRIGATRGLIVNAMAPIVTLVIAVTMLGEKFHLLDIWGMVLLFLGMLLLSLEKIWFPTRSIGKLFSQGVVVAVLATLFQGIGFTFRKVGIDTSMTALFAAVLDTVSALSLYVILLVMFGRHKNVIRISKGHVNLYIVAAGFLSAAAVMLFFVASDLIPVSQVSMITAIQPIIVALLSFIFMNKLERLTWVTIVCSVLVTTGVVLVGM